MITLSEQLRELQAAEPRTNIASCARSGAFTQAAEIAEAYEANLATIKPLNTAGVGCEDGKVVILLESVTVRLPLDGARRFVDALSEAIIELASDAERAYDPMPHDPEELQ